MAADAVLHLSYIRLRIVQSDCADERARVIEDRCVGRDEVPEVVRILLLLGGCRESLLHVGVGGRVNDIDDGNLELHSDRLRRHVVAARSGEVKLAIGRVQEVAVDLGILHDLPDAEEFTCDEVVQRAVGVAQTVFICRIGYGRHGCIEFDEFRGADRCRPAEGAAI